MTTTMTHHDNMITSDINAPHNHLHISEHRDDDNRAIFRFSITFADEIAQTEDFDANRVSVFMMHQAMAPFSETEQPTAGFLHQAGRVRTRRGSHFGSTGAT